MSVSDFGFWNQGFRIFWILDWVLDGMCWDFGFGMGFGFGIGFWVFDVGLDFGFPIWDFEFWILMKEIDFGSAERFWMLPKENWIKFFTYRKM